jgi:beta-1,4-glucuronyltransferase 1
MRQKRRNSNKIIFRWAAPVSIAVYAPGDDFQRTVLTILFLRNCHTQSALVREHATFHVFFESQFHPDNIHRDINDAEKDFVCPTIDSYRNLSNEKTFKSTHNLTYFINVGRNLARKAALTHFILASDIELYPNPGLVDSFFAMILRNQSKNVSGNNVFVLPIFEIAKDQKVPENKTELLELYHRKLVVWFHSKICAKCHTVPLAGEWINATDEGEMNVFSTSKRTKKFNHWEPLFIGTNDEPLYDERLSWEGRSDKMTQAYIMCLLDYNFNVLNNAFLIHKPGIKEKGILNEKKTNKDLILKEILPEIDVLHGKKNGCKI